MKTNENWIVEITQAESGTWTVTVHLDATDLYVSAQAPTEIGAKRVAYKLARSDKWRG